jgi:hypothetical protein
MPSQTRKAPAQGGQVVGQEGSHSEPERIKRQGSAWRASEVGLCRARARRSRRKQPAGLVCAGVGPRAGPGRARVRSLPRRHRRGTRNSSCSGDSLQEASRLNSIQRLRPLTPTQKSGVPGVAFEGLCVACQTKGILRPLLFCNSNQLAKVPCSFLSATLLLRDG